MFCVFTFEHFVKVDWVCLSACVHANCLTESWWESESPITAVRIVTLCKKNDHVTPYLKELHWLPIHFLRINFKILLITYKILNGLAPAYLSTLVKVYIPPRKLRSGSKDLLQPVRSHSVSYGDRPFSIVAPHLWNNLPLDIRTSKSVSAFKTKLKTYLFTKF